MEEARKERLVYIFSNPRFLKHIQQNDFEEHCCSWEDEDSQKRLVGGGYQDDGLQLAEVGAGSPATFGR